MKKRLFMALLAAAMMIAAFSFAAFADDDDDDDSEVIEEVKINAYIPEDASMSEGATYPEFEIVDNEGLFELTWEDPSSEISKVSSAKNAKTFTITLEANSGYIFDTTTNVTATGVESIGSKKVKEDGEQLVIKLDAYVAYQLNPPEGKNIEDQLDNTSASKISFDKNGATTAEYYIIYTDSGGAEHSVHGTTTSSSVSISSYTKEYTEKQHDNGYEDKVVIGFWIRGKDLKNCSNPYIAPSEWVQFGESEPDGELDEYSDWGDFINTLSSSKERSEATIGPTDTGATSSSSDSSGWSGYGKTWYYKDESGNNLTGWQQVNGAWYYLDANQNGIMLAGWQNISDYWYYFNEADGPTYGSMLTGWQNLGGYTYYLRKSAGSNGEPEGSMVVDTTIEIDGVSYTFDNNGVVVSQS